MATVTVGSDNGSLVELYYEDRGAGRAVVLIHGLLQDCRSWERQVAALFAAGFRVITHDRRRFTNSPEGKHVAALSHYQTKLRDAPPFLVNDGNAA
jgi:peroxiredoxin